MNSLFVETSYDVLATVTNDLYPKFNDNDIPPIQPIQKILPPRIERMNDLLITTAPTTLRRKKMKKNCVTFLNEVRVKQIRHVNDMKKKEKRNIWYSKKEIFQRHIEIKHVIDYMDTIEEKRFNTNDGDERNEEEKKESNDDEQKEEEKSIDDHNDDDDDDDYDEVEVCTRGLENHTKLGKNICRMKRHNAITSVLNEQRYQRSIGINEPHMLARVNNLNSVDSQNLAYLIAMKDYIVAYETK